jgi:hypothetical protein
MSTMRSAVDEMRIEELRHVSDDELSSDLVELEHVMRGLEAERSRRLAEFERRASFANDGFLSVTAWVVARLGLASSVAHRQVRLARALEEMPVVAESLASGEIAIGAAEMLMLARESDREAFGRCQEALLDAARSLPIAGLRNVIEYWRQAQDMAAAELREVALFERRRLHVSPTLDGMVRLDGDLDPETGEAVASALRAVMDADARTGDRSDARTPSQRRADALGQICRTWLDSSERPSVAGERPHVVVTLDLEALEGRAGRSALAEAGPITSETARRIACDANVSRVITDARSQPLDVGRASKVVPSALRRAVVVRDGGCRFPGCGRPPGWCDAHHVRHWADGGETALNNLVLLCRPHHRLIHRGFGVEMVEGLPSFRRPDGSPLGDRAPP